MVQVIAGRVNKDQVRSSAYFAIATLHRQFQRLASAYICTETIVVRKSEDARI